MQLKESGEMYLETIYVLSKKSNYIRSIDVCEEMGIQSRASAVPLVFSKMAVILKSAMTARLFSPTSAGNCRKTYERHTVLSKLFVSSELIPETAAAMPAKWNTLSATKPLAALKNHLENHMQ